MIGDSAKIIKEKIKTSRDFQLISTAGRFAIGYSVWVYNGWIEYRLTCVNTHVYTLEITVPATPELQDAIDEHFTYL